MGEAVSDEQAKIPAINKVGPRVFARLMNFAKLDVEWYHCERIALLDLGSISLEAGNTVVWNEERLTGLHERTMDKGRAIRRARPIELRLQALEAHDREVAKRRWVTFNGDFYPIVKQFEVEQENGSYLGIALHLPATLAAFAEERVKRKSAPRTPLEMLQDWAGRQTRRRVDDLHRQAVRAYGAFLHRYVDVVITGRSA